jgi:hypothetical protein
MTSAERQRRYLDRIRGTGATSTQLTKLKDENVTLRQQIAELEQALAAAQRSSTVQRKEEDDPWRFARRPSPDQHRIARLQSRVRELESLVLPLDDSQQDALRQHKRKVNRDFKRLWKAYEVHLCAHTVTMDSKDYTLFIAGFHPEASKEKRDQARNRFVDLYKKIVITDKHKVKWPPA